MPLDQSGGGDTAPELIYREIMEAQSDKAALTAPDLAERLDMTETTARKHLRELADRDDVKTREIGRAEAYWIDRGTAGDEITLPDALGIDTHVRLLDDMRVKWLRTHSEAYKYMENDGDTPALQAELAYRLYKYVQHALRYIPDDEEGYCLNTHLFFEVEWYGRVEGLRGLENYLNESLYKLSSADKKDILIGKADLDPDFSNRTLVETVYPRATNLLGAGVAADEYLSARLNVDW